MDIKFVNPYGAVSADYNNCMNSISMNIGMYTPATLTVDLLVDFTYNALINQYNITGLNILQERTLKSVIYTFINGYLNAATGEYLQYNATQMNYVFDLLEGTANSKNPEDILSQLQDIEDSVGISGLTADEQMPLLYAIQVGKTAYTYWANLMVTGMGNWGNFTNTFTPNIVKFPFWVAATIEGSLIANSYLNQQTKRGILAPELQLLINYAGGAPILVGMAGALAVGAGKVLFNLQQRKDVCLQKNDNPMGNTNRFYNNSCNC